MEKDKKEKILAIVVTHNRKKLLGECIDALLSQTYPFDAIYIIDNASTDGTPEYLIEKGYFDHDLSLDKKPLEIIKVITPPPFPDRTIELHYIRMDKNTGGAGGFHEGIKRGYKAGYDWQWLMDDDTIPSSEALSLLVSSHFFKNHDTGYLCSHVVWEDGNPHLMNVPHVFPFIKGKGQLLPFNSYLINGKAISISKCSFVSTLVSRKAIKTVGLPIKEFFIWGDDLEYTGRITQKLMGYYVFDSIVTHKTLSNYNVDITKDIPQRLPYYFFSIRNHIYMMKKDENKIPKILFFTFKELILALKRKDNKAKGIFITLKGLIFGYVFNPKIEYV